MNEEFKKILKDVCEISELLDYSPIFIWGVATYMYSLKYDFQLEISHDADFMVNAKDMFDLEELYGPSNPNKRLGKSEFLINDIEYDVYVENQNKLIFDYDKIKEYSIIVEDLVRCPAIEHLIALKMEAYIDRCNSEKGMKDKRDLIKLMYFCAIEYEENPKYLKDIALNIYKDKNFKFGIILENLKKIQNDNKAFLNITKNNSKNASTLKKYIDNYINILDNIKLRFSKELNLNLNLNTEEKNIKNRGKYGIF